MGPSIGVTMALAGALATAPATDGIEPLPFSPGVGYTVSQLLRQADAPPPAAEEATPAFSLVPRLPPPRSDLARIQGSPRARGLHAAAALAAQVAMIVAGVISVQEQRRQLRREREGQVQPYRPYR